MPWYDPWSENIKKRVCRYLLQRYLGQFLEEKLTLDQLSVDLFNGTGFVSHLRLDCESLNELGEAQGWPFEVVDGFVQQVNVSIPWANILKDDSFVQINGLTLTIQPKQRSENVPSMLESMWSSMTSSMQLATECLKQEGEIQTTTQPVEGIERFAQTIDSILCRVKVKFSNTTIRIEHVPMDSKTGVALEVHIKNIDYLDEAGSDPPAELLEAETNKAYVISTFTTKKISFEGVTLFTNEFPSRARTFSRSVFVDSNQSAEDKSFHQSQNPNSKPDSSDNTESTSQEYLNSSTPSPILFAKLAGRQEIRLTMKQSEEAIGPKIDFQLTLGSVTFFLSPRQFHVLMELANGLASPHLEDNSNVPLRSHAGMESKPMQKRDFERIEAQLTGRITAEHGISAKNGWSAATIEDSDQDEEKFLPLPSRHDNIMVDSITSTGSMSSSITSNASSLGSVLNPSCRGNSPYNLRRKRGIPQVEGDPNAETSQIHIRVASFAFVLLHEDILTFSSGSDCLSPSSVEQMKNISNNFFSSLGLLAISGYGSKDLDNANKTFDSAIAHNHLRFIAAPLILEGSEKLNSQGLSIVGHLTMARLDLRECLYKCNNSETKVQTVNILTFKQDMKIAMMNTENFTTRDEDHLCKTPNVKIAFNSIKKSVKVSGERKYVYPKTDIRVTMSQCTIDVDISIIDRMNAILYPQPVCKNYDLDKDYGLTSKQTVMEKNNIFADYSLDLKFSCPLLHIKLRFPVTDLRPLHDMSKPPWWQRNVRQDFLLGVFQNATVLNSSANTQLSTDIKIQCKQLDVFYLKSENEPEIHLGRATCNETDLNKLDPINGWPTFFINILPSNQSNDDYLDSTNNIVMSEHFTQPSSTYNTRNDYGRQSNKYNMGFSSIFMDKLKVSSCTNNDNPGPFSSKKMVHESDTPHAKDGKDDPEELVIPGDKVELTEFAEVSMKNSVIQLKCNLPVVSLQIISKQFYEVLYNRINSDLLLWEPSALKKYNLESFSGRTDSNVLYGSKLQESIYPAYSMCKSDINYKSDSDNSSSDTESDFFYSLYEQKARQGQKPKSAQKVTYCNEKTNQMNNICFQLQIGKGLLTLYTPVRDTSNHVIPVQQGEVVILVDDLSMCYVGGVGGDLRSGLVSLQANNAQIYHCGLIPNPSDRVPLRMCGYSLPSYLKCLIHASEKSISVKPNGYDNGRNMLSIATSIKPNKEHSGYKTIKVAIGIANSTLRHVMVNSQHSWLNQILDMFDVIDYPVPGYDPSIVITELHVHLWDCAIDYRPLYLPLHTIITIGSFSISSNVVANTNASNLRFIAEECALFLSDDIDANKIKVDLSKNFVSVIDIGLFELSVRLNDKTATAVPRLDLRASNNEVHVRTCSDSFKALCRLINYLASDGDFNDPENFDSGASDVGSYGHTTEPDFGALGENNLIGVNEKSLDEIRDLSKSQVQHVNDMMAEAMKENIDCEDISNEREQLEAGVEIFFFPDESKTGMNQKDVPVNKGFKKCSFSDISSTQQDDPDTENQIRTSKKYSEHAEAYDFECINSNGTSNNQPPAPIVTRDLGDFNNPNQCRDNNIKIPKKPSGDSNTDDEFCILDEDTKRYTVVPEVKWLTNEPVHMIDNHFSIPVGKTDLLKPPKNFPIPVLRYTLCEMTLILHMYGGNDFKSTINQDGSNQSETSNKGTSFTPNKKTVTINDGNNKQSPTFSHRDSSNSLPKSSTPPINYGTQRGIYYQGAVGYNKSSESVSQSHSKDRMPGSPREIPLKHRGGSGRRHDILMELQLNKVRFQHETYPTGGVESSRQVLIISSVEVRDRLASSQINKFLYQYISEHRPKQKHANMVVIKAVHLRPDPKLSAQECCLKISLLPLRFNIDQDALLFLISFFGQFSESDNFKDNSINSVNSGSNQSLHSIGGSSRHSTPTHQPPIMSVNTVKTGYGSRRPSNASKSGTESDNIMISSDCISEDALSIKEEENDCINPQLDSYEAERLVSDNLIRLEEDMKLGNPTAINIKRNIELEQNLYEEKTTLGSEMIDDAPVYFRNVVFSPDVPIRLDYHGKRVDLTHGPLAGLLMGLAQLNCSELRLKSLSYRHGLLGFERLLKWAVQEWISDIKRHQLPSLLGGVGPMHSLVQLFQGIRDLFWLPIEQYQRDGRLVRGLQRGASSFTTSTAMAALDITARIIHLIQATAETAYDMVSPSPGLRGPRVKGRRRHARARQPQDIREGVTNAYHLVKEGLGETAQALADVASTERSARGYSGAVGGVLRQLPPTAIAPILLASEAAARVLGGVRATLAPADHRDHRDKWRSLQDSSDNCELHHEADTYSDE